MLLNCGVGEDSWESLGQQGDQSWVFIGRTDAATEAPILWPPDAKNWLIWKDPYAGKRLKAGGKGGDRGWDSWMASLTQWTWVWANSKRQWRTGKPGMLQSMGSQRVRPNWATEQLYPDCEFCEGNSLYFLLVLLLGSSWNIIDTQ